MRGRALVCPEAILGKKVDGEAVDEWTGTTVIERG
jgi:hypothetical protein